MLTSQMSIPVDARGFLMKHRDAWKEEHGVSVWFPRHERFGSFQTMHMSGTTAEMGVVKRKVSCVLAEAERERAAYLERRKNRQARRVGGSRHQPVRETKTITVSKPVNLFSALESIGDADVTPKAVGSKRDVPVPHGPAPREPRAPQGCWAKGAAKFPQPLSPVGAAPAKVIGVEPPAADGWGPIVGAWADDE